MNKIKGFRTMTVNILALIYLALPLLGIDVPVPEQEAITAGVLALVNIGLRTITTTPMGEA